MCWTTCYARYAEVKTAREDIPVYKVVKFFSGEGVPYFMGRYPRFYEVGGGASGTYREGRTYFAEGFCRPCPRILFTGRDRTVIAAVYGFHSYSDTVSLAGGLHRCSWVFERKGGMPAETQTVYVAEEDGGLADVRVMECVIPKGSRYCVNEHGEYVSDKIRVTGFALMETRVEKWKPA